MNDEAKAFIEEIALNKVRRIFGDFRRRADHELVEIKLCLDEDCLNLGMAKDRIVNLERLIAEVKLKEN